jgi:hypothetical protein
MMCAKLPTELAALARNGSYALEHAWRNGYLHHVDPLLERRLYESLPETYFPTRIQNAGNHVGPEFENSVNYDI